MLVFDDDYTTSESGVASPTGWIRALGRPPAFGATQWSGAFQGHEIRVTARGFLRARLYIDGKLLDKRHTLVRLDRRIPLLSGRVLTEGPEVIMVHVYRSGSCPIQIEVRAAGRPIAMNRTTSETVVKGDGS